MYDRIMIRLLAILCHGAFLRAPLHLRKKNKYASDFYKGTSLPPARGVSKIMFSIVSVILSVHGEGELPVQYRVWIIANHSHTP